MTETPSPFRNIEYDGLVKYFSDMTKQQQLQVLQFLSSDTHTYRLGDGEGRIPNTPDNKLLQWQQNKITTQALLKGLIETWELVQNDQQLAKDVALRAEHFNTLVSANASETYFNTVKNTYRTFILSIAEKAKK